MSNEDENITDEDMIKGNLEAIKERIPKIIEEAEEQDYKSIVKNAKTLEKYLEK